MITWIAREKRWRQSSFNWKISEEMLYHFMVAMFYVGHRQLQGLFLWKPRKLTNSWKHQFLVQHEIVCIFRWQKSPSKFGLPSYGAWGVNETLRPSDMNFQIIRSSLGTSRNKCTCVDSDSGQPGPKSLHWAMAPQDTPNNTHIKRA